MRDQLSERLVVDRPVEHIPCIRFNPQRFIGGSILAHYKEYIIYQIFEEFAT